MLTDEVRRKIGGLFQGDDDFTKLMRCRMVVALLEADNYFQSWEALCRAVQLDTDQRYRHLLDHEAFFTNQASWRLSRLALSHLGLIEALPPDPLARERTLLRRAKNIGTASVQDSLDYIGLNRVRIVS